MDEVDFFPRTSRSYSRQGWRDLLQRIVNNEINTNVLQEYPYRWINEYKLEEHERIYRIARRPLLCLPSRSTIESKSVPFGAIVRYLIMKNDITSMMIIDDKSLAQKHVTSNTFTRNDLSSLKNEFFSYHFTKMASEYR